MKYVDYVGIDVSKKTLDVSFHKLKLHRVFPNNKAGFEALLDWVEECYDKTSDVLFCFEHTGLYSERLCYHLESEKIGYVLVCGLVVKRSMGIRRGKSDLIDSKVIARYIYKNYEELQLSATPAKQMILLKKLFSLRTLIVKHRTAYKALINEKELLDQGEEFSLIIDTHQEMERVLTDKIDAIEDQMRAIVQSDPKLRNNMKLACSVKGIGPQTALYLIITTENFTRFENWRKYACYAGTAPFPHQSGTSIRGRSKVSNLANKKIKALLSNAATSAIQHCPEMKAYFERRIKAGKNIMSTINIVRNKLLGRVFAVVKRQTPYVQLLNR